MTPDFDEITVDIPLDLQAGDRIEVTLELMEEPCRGISFGLRVDPQVFFREFPVISIALGTWM